MSFADTLPVQRFSLAEFNAMPTGYHEAGLWNEPPLGRSRRIDARGRVFIVFQIPIAGKHHCDSGYVRPIIRVPSR